jgi:hypothetical protein
MKNATFWDVEPCGSCKSLFCSVLVTDIVDLTYSFHFDYGGEPIFLRNVGSNRIHTV